MNVLIAGAAGFIGSNLCETLLKQGYTVMGIDNFITGNQENIKLLKNYNLFEFKEIDITYATDVADIISNINFDWIFHFASPASPQDYLAYPLKTMETNSFGTYNLLKAIKTNQSKFLLASTSEIYGDSLENPQRECYYGNVNTLDRRAVYDEAKRFAETLTHLYYTQYNYDTKIARIFNTYGPRMQNDGRVIIRFIDQALGNQPLIINGDGLQTRSFCFISDLIKGILKLMESDVNDAVNLGNPNEVTTILQLAKLVIELTNSKSDIVFNNLSESEPQVRKPNISKARELLGWKPRISLIEGLKETINWVNSKKDK